MPTKKPRYCITVDEKTLSQIDQFCRDMRYASRSQATVELIRLGLENIKNQKEDSTKK